MAWKRNEPEPPAPSPPPPVAKPARPAKESATIGASIRIKGDLSGDEDLLIQGQIQGQIKLQSHNVTVGPSGRVKADIHGRTIRVEGEVDGNLFGEEEIVIRASGRVQGNLAGPARDPRERLQLQGQHRHGGRQPATDGGGQSPPRRRAASRPPPAAKLATDPSKG